MNAPQEIGRAKIEAHGAGVTQAHGEDAAQARGDGATQAHGDGAAYELELKLVVPQELRDAVAAALATLGEPPALRLRARYYDTPDGRLHDARIALRLRHEDGSWVQTLKCAPDAATPWRRIEHEVTVPGADAEVPPPLDPARHDASPAIVPLRAVLGERFDGAPLVERYRTDVLRRSMPLLVDGAVVEIAFDEGEIIAGGIRLRVCEIELELKSGEPAPMIALARRWIAELGLWLDPEPKSARGERLVRGELEPPAVRAGAVALDATMSGDEATRAIVRGCLAQVLPNAASLAGGCVGDEHVHQLRVGLRRLRTALRELRSFSDGIRQEWNAPARAAFATLGAARDTQVVLTDLRTRLAGAGVQSGSWLHIEPLHPELLMHTVRDEAFQGLLLDLLEFGLPHAPPGDEDGHAIDAAGAPSQSASPANGPHEQDCAADSLATLFRTRLKRLHRAVVRDGERFETLADEERHRVRKRLKRLRYLCEFAAPLYERQAGDLYVAALREAQDALGGYNDASIGLAVARRAAKSGDDQAAQAVRWLAKDRKAAVRRCRKALAAVNETRRFWKR